MTGRTAAGEQATPDRTVLVIDDDDVVCRAVTQLLATRGLASICSESVEGALRATCPGQCGVVILDLTLPGVGGVEALRTIKRTLAPVEVVVLTGTATVEVAMDCVRCGAFDLLTKPVNGAQLLECVEWARALGSVRQLAGAEPGCGDPGRTRLHARLLLAHRRWHLSPRQRDVLLGLVLGQSNKQIAQHTHCAERTVEMHVTDLFRKAGVEGRCTLLAKFWLMPMD